MAYQIPQAQVFQEFAQTPVALSQVLRACPVGEQFDLHRYSVAAEKSGIQVAANYDPTGANCYNWPSRNAGAVVDPSYTKVFIDNALLQYYHNATGVGTPIRWAGTAKNKIRAENQIFETANGYTRSTVLLRDVLIGDIISIIGVVGGIPVTLPSQVIGLEADTVPSSIGTAVANSGNQAHTVAAATGSQTGGTHNEVEVSVVDGSTYNGLATGNPSEVYTAEVVLGGGAGEAVLRITSQSGNDDAGLVTFTSFGTAFAIGSRGLKATFALGSSVLGASPEDQFIVGQIFTFYVTQDFTPSTVASSGQYTGATNTTYLVKVKTGGKFSGGTPQIVVSTTTGIDVSGPTTVTASTVPVQVGTQDVYIAFTGTALCAGDQYTIPAVAAAPGAVRTLVLANNLPAGMREGGPSSSIPDETGEELDVTLFIEKNISVPAIVNNVTNWTQAALEICLQAGIESTDTSWASGGTLVPLPVMGGIVYVEHRDKVLTNSYAIGTVADIGSVPAVLGTVHPDNPLAYGVYKALLNSNGESVAYLAVGGGNPATLNDWLAALAKLTGHTTVYTLVPLTYNIDVCDAFSAHVDANSTPTAGRWRRAKVCLQAKTTFGVYVNSFVNPTQPVLAEIVVDPDAPGTQYLLVEATGEKFLTNGVRAGDTVRAEYGPDGIGGVTYQSFQVDTVLNEETIRLVSGPSQAVVTPSKIEVWRTPTQDELAATLAKNPGLFSDRRVDIVWPDQLGDSGMTVPGYFLNCALAGLRSGVLPHQGLTNVAVVGFDDLSRTTVFFTSDQLDVLAAAGYWIVTQDPATGAVYTRQQLTTGDQSNVNKREESACTNFDQISYTFLAALSPLIGKGNVTPTMIDILQGTLQGVINTYVHTIISNILGPQIISAKITQIAQNHDKRISVLEHDCEKNHG